MYHCVFHCILILRIITSQTYNLVYYGSLVPIWTFGQCTNIIQFKITYLAISYFEILYKIWGFFLHMLLNVMFLMKYSYMVTLLLLLIFNNKKDKTYCSCFVITNLVWILFWLYVLLGVGGYCAKKKKKSIFRGHFNFKIAQNNFLCRASLVLSSLRCLSYNLLYLVRGNKFTEGLTLHFG